MPELPEVETIRSELQATIRGKQIAAVEVHRVDVIRGRATPTSLLQGTYIKAFLRHGKQLAMLGTTRADNGAKCVCFHLGMSGTFILRKPAAAKALPHTHVIWYLHGGGALHYRDPRRFGGIWTFPNQQRLLESRWNTLGPDALTISPADLHARFLETRRAVKIVLLDQHALAGLGNIYVDELLFRCQLNPRMPARAVKPHETAKIIRQMRRLLKRAIREGGTTLRDYRGATGQPGHFQESHQVYGRSGMPCVRCNATLQVIQVASRSTVFCPFCQKWRRGGAR